jgi:hypothetical protein
LVRERASNLRDQSRTISECFATCNAQQKSLLESFLRAPTPTLHDLVASTEREFRAKESQKRSARPTDWESDDERTIQTTTRDFIPR